MNKCSLGVRNCNTYSITYPRLRHRTLNLLCITNYGYFCSSMLCWIESQASKVWHRIKLFCPKSISWCICFKFKSIILLTSLSVLSLPPAVPDVDGGLFPKQKSRKWHLESRTAIVPKDSFAFPSNNYTQLHSLSNHT